MSFEKYISVYDGGAEGMNLRPMGKAFSLDFDLDVKDNKNYRLFTVGETEAFYQWKNEPNCPARYQTLSDALDSVHAEKSQFCVDFSSKKCEKFGTAKAIISLLDALCDEFRTDKKFSVMYGYLHASIGIHLKNLLHTKKEYLTAFTDTFSNSVLKEPGIYLKIQTSQYTKYSLNQAFQISVHLTAYLKIQ